MIASASAAPATNGFDLPSGQMRERLITYRGFVQQSIIRKQLTGDNEMCPMPPRGDGRKREGERKGRTLMTKMDDFMVRSQTALGR